MQKTKENMEALWDVIMAEVEYTFCPRDDDGGFTRKRAGSDLPLEAIKYSWEYGVNQSHTDKLGSSKLSRADKEKKADAFWTDLKAGKIPSQGVGVFHKTCRDLVKVKIADTKAYKDADDKNAVLDKYIEANKDKVYQAARNYLETQRKAAETAANAL